MAKRITIDPITRIEGHLRIDVEVDNNAVSNAWASCTMWRGIEKILRGRDPRDAWLFTQRFCGVCTTVHAMASVRSVEDALNLEIPLNAQYIRNLILIAHALHDHIVHFYQLSALDWVDVLQIPKADPAATSKLAETISPWTRNSRNELKAAQDRVNAVASSGQLGIFANGYWGHPAMKLPPTSTCWHSRIMCRRWSISARRCRLSPSWDRRRRIFRTSRLAAWPTPLIWTASPLSAWTSWK